MSSIPAPLQIGRSRCLQYCLLQSLQFPALNSTLSSSFLLLSPFSSPGLDVGMSEGLEGGSSGRGSSSSSFSAFRAKKRRDVLGVLEVGASMGIIVLLLKQVHLQKEVGAQVCQRGGLLMGLPGNIQDASVRHVKTRREARPSSSRDVDFMVVTIRQKVGSGSTMQQCKATKIDLPVKP